MSKLHVGDYVIKETGDYRYYGWVVAILRKTSGTVRYVVENPDGMLFIMHDAQLRLETPYEQSCVGSELHKRYMDNLKETGE